MNSAPVGPFRVRIVLKQTPSILHASAHENEPMGIYLYLLWFSRGRGWH